MARNFTCPGWNLFFFFSDKESGLSMCYTTLSPALVMWYEGAFSAFVLRHTSAAVWSVDKQNLGVAIGHKRRAFVGVGCDMVCRLIPDIWWFLIGSTTKETSNKSGFRCWICVPPEFTFEYILALWKQTNKSMCFSMTNHTDSVL